MNILNIVLIETLWNVKKYESTRIWVKKDGINRNIVECKELSAEFQKQTCEY